MNNEIPDDGNVMTSDSPAAATPVLQCRRVSKVFDQGSLNVSALREVDFSVARGERVAIVGASGSGKTTLLQILGGLARPSEGEALVDGRNINRLSARESGVLRNHALGFVYQFHHLLMEFSALENVAMPLLIRRMPRAKSFDMARDILTRVGLRHRIDHKPGELSGGERQRAAVARALVTRPKCLLADEPTGNLDSKTAAAIHELLLELNREFELSLVIATHDRRLAEQMGRVVVIEDGRIVRG